MRGGWQGARARRQLLWQTREGYSANPTGGEPARETVRYEALVYQVELLQSGELALGPARELIDRGRGLRLGSTDDVGALRAFSAAGGEREGAVGPRGP
eukprot:1894119-Alexandrium_andersonii.AAC.1